MTVFPLSTKLFFLEEEDPCNDTRVAEGEIDDGALSSSSKKRKNNVSGVTKRPKRRLKQVENTGKQLF